MCRLSGDLLQHVIKRCLKESYQQLQKAQSLSKTDFELLLCDVPVSFTLINEFA